MPTSNFAYTNNEPNLTSVVDQFGQKRRKDYVWAVGSASTVSRTAAVVGGDLAIAGFITHLQGNGLVVGSRLKGTIDNETIESPASTGAAVQHELMDLLSQIRVSVENELIPKARKLLACAIQLGVDSELLNRWRRVLALPLLKPQTGATATGTKASVAWLRHNASQYRGKWVALRDGQLVAVADKRIQLHKMLKNERDISNTTVMHVSG